MTTEPTDLVHEIETLAPQAGAIHGQMVAAIDAERSAEAQVLARAIDLARPALRSVCSRLLLGVSTQWHDNAYTQDTNAYSKTRTVRLAGDDGPSRDHPRDTAGRYEGCSLHLCSDGILYEVTYVGHWSKWQGTGSAWQACLREVTPREAMDDWELSDCLAVLRDALQSVVQGKAPERANAARARAERLAALCTLSV